MTAQAPQSTPSPPDYVAAFDLECDPYEDGHEARFFYADPALMQRLDLLQHLTRFSEQLLYVRAPEGAGKTMLLHQLRLRAADHWRVCQLDGSHPGTPAELYVQLARCYPDAAAEGTEHFGSDLIHYCLGLQQSGQLAVLIVDDAERLPAPVLEALLNLARSPVETLKALRILLFASPELEPTLHSLAPAGPGGDALVHTLDLPPFDEQQSAAYLMYRLAIAGYSGDSPFSGTEVRAMHKTAAGRPGPLNRLARETLQEQLQRRALPRRSTGRQAPRRRWPRAAGTVLALLAVLAGGWWQLARQAPGPGPIRDQRLQLPPANPLASSTETPADTAPGPEPAEPDVPALAGRETEAAPAATDSDPQPMPPATSGTTEPPPARPAAEPAPAAEPTEAAETTAAEAAPPSAGPSGDAGPATEAAGNGPQGDSATAPAPTAAPAPAAPVDWLARQPDGHYTLQLLGARAEETVERFLARHGDQLELHPIRTWRGDAAWHIVVTGSYPGRDAAAAAIEALPPALRRLKPWPRRFEQIRADRPPA